MPSISVNNITNANVYLNGANHAGKAEEAKLPDIVQTMRDHKALGMIGTAELPAGIDKMTATIKWSSLYADIIKATANPYAANSVQIRGSLETWGAAGRTTQVPVVAFLTGTFKKLPGGTWKKGEGVESESEMAVSYYKLTIAGQDVVEVDIYANIYKVDGVDVLAQFNQNLGG